MGQKKKKLFLQQRQNIFIFSAYFIMQNSCSLKEAFDFFLLDQQLIHSK